MAAIIKVSIIFILIIIMLRRRISIGNTMMAATVLLGFMFGLGVIELLRQFFFTLIDYTTIELITALVLIMVLESIMRKTGMLEGMTKSLFVFPFNQRVLTALIPAIIGLLPSAGGARFSAPLVEQATVGMPYRPEDKVFINYWFRHIWEYSLPLYPGLILAAHLAEVPLGSFVLVMIPFSIAWILLGYWIIFKLRKAGLSEQGEGVGTEERLSESVDFWPTMKDFFSCTWPIWVTVALVVAGIPIGFALVLVLLALVINKRYPLLSVVKTLREPFTVGIVFLTWGTLAFKDVLGLSGAIAQISGYIASVGIPFLPVLIILPLISGMLTGVVQACVGVSFPLIMSIIDPHIGHVMLAFVSGIVGVQISPIHLCLILTVDYFRADFLTAYKSLLLPSLALIVIAFGFYWVI